MKKISDEKIEAQLTKYFQKVITNAAFNYYKKKLYQIENEYPVEIFFDELYDASSFEDELLNKIMINKSFLAIFGVIISEILHELTNREKSFLIEKFILNKTDNEIGILFGVSRQAITNMKHRLYRKIRNKINKEKIL